MNMAELGGALRAARVAAGLSQARLAALVGVSRATINTLENGGSQTVSATLLAAASIVGLGITVEPLTPRAPQAVLEWAAGSASTSYAASIPAAALRDVMGTGTCPDEYRPHISALLSETSDSRLVETVKACAALTATKPAQVWANLQGLAEEVKCPHPRWHGARGGA